MKRAVYYVRESPSLAENENTKDSQISALVEKIKTDNNIFIGGYVDNGWAGDLLARPDLDRLRDDATQSKFDVLYIFDRSRLARKYWLQELVVEELEEKNIEVIFIQEPQAHTDEERVLQGIKGVFFEYERAKIRERTRRGRLHLAKQGKMVGHEAPFGYRYVRPDHNKEERWYEILEDEAKIINMIFEWVGNEGCSLTEVRRRLHEKQIKTKSGNKTIWSNSTLSRLLRRNDYIGKSFYNKTLSVVPQNPRNNGYKRMKKTGRVYKPKEEWLPIAVPAIVDEDLFYRTQEQLKNNTFFNKRNQKFPYLLSGLLFCGCGCEARMAGDGQGKKYRYYRSTDRIKKFPEKRVCTALSVPVDKIENLVWNKIVKFLNDPEMVLKQLRNIENKKVKEHEQLKNSLLDIQKRLEKVNIEEERIATAFRKGFLTLEQLNIQMKDINKQKEQIKTDEKVALSQPSNADTQLNPEAIKRYCKIMQKKLPKLNFAERQELLRLFVNKVIVKGRKVNIQGEIPIDNTLQLNDVSQSQFSSSSGFGRSPSGSGSGRFIPFPSILYYRRIAG